MAKKKIKKRLEDGMQQYVINPSSLFQIPKTYREIKNQRKIIHKRLINQRHMMFFGPQGYQHQLWTRRRLRKDWQHVVLAKCENFKEEIDNDE